MCVPQSGIHGWGLIARAEMKQDSMVVEYRGDLLRPKMSDDRQKLYNRIGKDCYLFNVNDDVVIDATMTGAVGRFTVSSRAHLWLLLGDVCAFMLVPFGLALCDLARSTNRPENTVCGPVAIRQQHCV